MFSRSFQAHQQLKHSVTLQAFIAFTFMCGEHVSAINPFLLFYSMYFNFRLYVIYIWPLLF
jgi:hypothetical protein